MFQKNCPNCGKQISESEFCLHCGMPLTEQAKKSPSQRAMGKQSQEQFNLPLCILMCCCLTPIGGLCYYLIAKSE